MANKLYVLVRGDLSKSQQAVQACHAVANFMLYSNTATCGSKRCTDEHVCWENETIVLLKTKDLNDLELFVDKLEIAAENYSFFLEEDLGDEMTAVAAWGGELENLLKDLPLL